MRQNALTFYLAVFLISCSIICLQIFQSRIFSVTTWYHLSFLAISFAMFGMTLGALRIYGKDEAQQRRDFGKLAQRHTFAFGLAVLLSLFAQLYIPVISTDVRGTLITLPIVAAITCLAYYHSGIVITLCLTRTPFPLAKTYGIDLLGAGFGCIVALCVMETIDTPSGVVFLASVILLSSLLFRVEAEPEKANPNPFTIKNGIAGLMCFTLILGFINLTASEKILFPVWIKDRMLEQEITDYEKWNSISRITVHKLDEHKPYLWGASPVAPMDMEVNYNFLLIDGAAGTPITQFDGDFSKHKYLEYDVTNIAYTLPNIQKAAIIGVGGGRDLLSAKYFNVGEVWAMDVNPVQIELLANDPVYSKYTNLSTLPGVHLVNSEARSWFRNNTVKMDLVQMSLIDTWAATGAGAYALSENGIYTVEAWKIFIDDLTPNGVFTVSRWSSDSMDDSARMLSVGVATLFKLGIEDVRSHIAIIKSRKISTLILSKSPMTPEQITAIRKTSTDKQYNILMIPDEAPQPGILKNIVEAKTLDDINKISSQEALDVTPSTDMRPFFFNQAKFSRPFDIVNMALSDGTVNDGVAFGQAKATLNLFIIIILSFLMVTFTIIYPIVKRIRQESGLSHIRSGTLYFLLIGFGFMFIEISLLNALGVYLGHPVYGLGVVLFSLIISAGLGSLLSDVVPLSRLPAQMGWSIAIFAYCIGLALSLDTIFTAYAEVDIMSRALISVAMVAPAGILLGFGFPTGLKIVQAFDTRATAWFWGINGAAGVMGSCIAVALNIAFGVDKTLMVGGFCYLLLCLAFYGVMRAQSKAKNHRAAA